MNYGVNIKIMSKNFYGVIKSEVTDWEDKKQRSLNEAGRMKGLYPVIEEYYEKRKPKELHLGQSANGWVFLFQYNDGKYYTNKSEFLEFIKTLEIYDEYKCPYTAEEFWQYTQDDLITDKSRTVGDNSVKVIDGMEFLNCWFS